MDFKPEDTIVYKLLFATPLSPEQVISKRKDYLTTSSPHLCAYIWQHESFKLQIKDALGLNICI